MILTTLIENNLVINKKTPARLSSFCIVDNSLDSEKEVNNLTENNQEDLNLDFNEKSPLPNYNIDTFYSHQVVSRSKMAKDVLNLEDRFTALKNYIECEISSLDYKFQFVCDKLKTINILEYETIITLQNGINFLQNKVVSEDAIIEMLLEIQTGNLDLGTNCTSQDKDKITSINITDDSLIPVNQNKKNREQNKEKMQIKNFQI